MSRDEAGEYRQAFESFEREHPDYMSGMKRQKLHLVTTWMAELVRRPEILDAVEDILGPDFLCCVVQPSVLTVPAQCLLR